MHVHAFRAAVEARDLPAMAEALADDVAFHSPVAFRPFEGRVVVEQVLGHVMETFEDFRYVDELAGDGTHALIFRARIGERQIHGLDHFELDGDGRIAVFTVMVRPLSGVIALAEAMGPKVADLKS
jgi:SnoaL-like domain